MRKIIAVTASVAILASLMLPLSEASRLVYHRYSQNIGKYKRHSQRISPYNYGRKIKRTNYHGPRNHWRTHKAEEYIVRNPRYYYPGPAPTPITYPVRLLRSSSNQIIPSYKYMASIPDNFIKQSDGIYQDQNSSLKFRILQTPEKYKCYRKSFKICAIDLGKGFKREQTLGQIDPLFSSYRYNHTNANSFSRYPIFVESFKSSLMGSDNVYFIFNALHPVDGSIVRIEAVVREKEKSVAANTMFKIFESFRIKNYY